MVRGVMLPALGESSIFFSRRACEGYLRCYRGGCCPLFACRGFVCTFTFVCVSSVPLFRGFVIVVKEKGKGSKFVMPLTGFFRAPLCNIRGCRVRVITGTRSRTGRAFGITCGIYGGGGFGKGFDIAGRLVAGLGAKSRLGCGADQTRAGSKGGPKYLVLGRVRTCRGCSRVGIFRDTLKGMGRPQRFVVAAGKCIQSKPLSRVLAVVRRVLEAKRGPLKCFPFIYGLSAGRRGSLPRT